MTVFRNIFQNRHVVLPVIHVKSVESALKNATIAYESGCDGVFLINMQNPETLERINFRDLRKIQKIIRKKYQNLWIGINFLDLSAESVFEQVDSDISGIWADNAQIHEKESKQTLAETIMRAKLDRGWEGLYFGGVAFKYQPEVDNPALAAKIATEYMDVITTSGTQTGSAPDVGKIAKMKEAIGDFPLAIASGVSILNIKDFLPIADCFIVASSLLKPNTDDFDDKRVRDLVKTVRQH
jgi:predicted TIM-barrel enzyme